MAWTARAAVLTCLAGLTAGCPSGPFPPDPPDDPAGKDFDSAARVTLNDNGQATLTGSISDDETDVYDLGAVEPGDKLNVAIQAASGSDLDPVLALFDENGELFAYNDDVNLSAGQTNSAVQDTVTVGGEHLFVAVTRFFSDTEGGAYVGQISVQRGMDIPTPATQYLRLNFAGGSITIPGEGTYNVDPFNAADVDAAYTGLTNSIKSKIITTVGENFADTGLVIITDQDAAPEEAVSTLFFGAFSASKFGVAQDVDQGNRDRCDDGIVFTDNFDDPFTPRPSANDIAVAIGNVAAHEAGHLLGLNHVSNVDDLMDNTGTASTLLADQDFMTSPLSLSIFPIGEQNGPALLERVIP